MADLISIIEDTFPANEDLGVPLRSTITLTFTSHLDEESVDEAFFIEGPDTDQFVGVDLDLQIFPDNISQGDDFLESPGFAGIVQGVTKLNILTSGVTTQLEFTPTHPLAALTKYIVHLSDVNGSDFTTFSGITYSGHITFSFTTGTGSIQEVPTTVSTSVLTTLNQKSSVSSLTPFKVVTTSPVDHSIEQKTTTPEIVVEFNKDIEPSTVIAEDIEVKTIPATDHPSGIDKALGDLAKNVVVEGNKLKIKI